MSTTYTQGNLAEGRIRQAISRLLAKYPFHAHILERCRLHPSTSLDTMGVTATCSGVLLLFNPDFTLGLPIDQLGGVLLHEVLHVVLGHLTLDPANYPDTWAFTVAMEVSVNEFVHEPLPAGVIKREQYPMLPPMESTDERYRRLVEVRDRENLGPPSSFLGAPSDGPASVLDDHTVWTDAHKDPDAARKALADLIQQAAMDGGGLPEELQQAILAAIGAIGSEAGACIHVFQGGRRGQLDWKKLLRRYIGQVLEPRPLYNRPPRRFPALVGILPGQRRAGAQPSVVAIIDTSGSITPENLEEIDGELRRLSRSHPVHVIEADCEVHRVYRYGHGKPPAPGYPTSGSTPRGHLRQQRGPTSGDRGVTSAAPPTECVFLAFLICQSGGRERL